MSTNTVTPHIDFANNSDFTARYFIIPTSEPIPYAKVENEGATYVLVPQAVYEQNKAALDHDHHEPAGIEFLPDFFICSTCHQLLRYGNLQEGFVPATMDDLEAAIADHLKDAIENIDDALAALNNCEVTRLIEWLDGLARHNAIYKARAQAKAKADQELWDRVQANLQARRNQAQESE